MKTIAALMVSLSFSMTAFAEPQEAPLSVRALLQSIEPNPTEGTPALETAPPLPPFHQTVAGKATIIGGGAFLATGLVFGLMFFRAQALVCDGLTCRDDGGSVPVTGKQ